MRAYCLDIYRRESVADERGRRKAYTALVLMKSACVITFPRREITDDKCRYSKPASGCGMTNKKEGSHDGRSPTMYVKTKCPY